MTRSFGLGPMPGTSVAEAADIIVSETSLPHLPLLPAHGLGYDPVAVTAAMVPHVSITRGPRGWVLADRPSAPRLDGDLDACEAVWGELPAVKMQALGPFSLAASVELASGHRAITDRGALRDLTEALIDGLSDFSRGLARRFGGDVVVQLDEPLLPAIVAGQLRGTSDLDSIRAIHPEDLRDGLSSVVSGLDHEVLLNQAGYAPLWEVAPCEVLVSVDKVRGTAQLDGLGEALSAGRVGLGVARGGSAREAAVGLARLVAELGVDPVSLAGVDVFPGSTVLEPARDYAFVAEVAAILECDAGDL